MNTRGAVFEWMNRKETNQIKYVQNFHRSSYKECKAIPNWTCHCDNPFISASFEKDPLSPVSMFRWEAITPNTLPETLLPLGISWPSHYTTKMLCCHHCSQADHAQGAQPREACLHRGSRGKKAKLSDRGKEQPGRSCSSPTTSHLRGFALCKALEGSHGALGAKARSFGSQRKVPHFSRQQFWF